MCHRVMECDELLRHIKFAFADAPAPSDDNIVCHECAECLTLRDDVRGHTPDELPDSWVERSFDQLPFFSDDAKRFYLPAFLRLAVLKPDSLVAQFLLYALSDEFRMHPSGGYSPHQKQVIRAYLEYAEHRVDDHGREYVEKAKTFWQPGT
jgi:hypothetical protein